MQVPNDHTIFQRDIHKVFNIALRHWPTKGSGVQPCEKH